MSRRTFAFDEFFAGFVLCALSMERDWAQTDGGQPLEKNYTAADIADEALAALLLVCIDFTDANAADLDLYCQHLRGAFSSASAVAGCDFWLTATGHGVGYWCRDGVGEDGVPPGPDRLGARLTTAAQRHSNLCLYVGDDGRIYCA